jgi:hypothetical protein
MSGEVLAAARLLFEPGQVVEVRAITEYGMASGYFDSVEALSKRVEALDSSPEVQAIYVTLNQVNPALFARRANRVKMRLGKKDATTADSDITARTWLPIDIDPVRPSGVSSTDEEHQAALERAGEIASYLESEWSWPEPVRADSGNGAHLLYRIALPNDDAARDLVRRCLETLAARFDDKKATVDTANFNAARIWKLYGTMSRKGDHTRERPHRRARVLSAPDSFGVVSRAKLERLAESGVPPYGAEREKDRSPPETQGRPIDLRTWLPAHGIGWSSEKPYEGGTLFTLDECPFSGEHKDGAYAIQFPSGAVHVACHHQSCGGGVQRWHELRNRLETGPGRRKTVAETKPRPPGPVIPVPSCTAPPGKDEEPPDSPDDPNPSADPELSAEALGILSDGDPKRYFLKTFALDHEGDEAVAECLVLSLASRAVVNTNGLHVSITGESGKGKSHAFSTMLRQVPKRFRLEGAMSNKALFYMDGLQAGSVIILDDRALSEEMAEMLKSVITSFKKPFIYRTVNKDRRGQVCSIPERCVWWLAKVEGAGDDQVCNRMLTCWIDDSPEQDDRVLTHVLNQNRELPDEADGEPREVRVCRAMWEIIARQQVHVVIPFAPGIRFQTYANRRNPEMLLDLIKANALLNMMQRERCDSGGYYCIQATRADFDEAVRLYALLNGTAGGQTTKLTRRESDIIGVIASQTWEEFTIPMLQKSTDISNGTLHRVLHGYSSRGSVYTGLLEKCPAIAYTDRTESSEDVETGAMTRRRTNAYTFDKDLYARWCAGTTVWIEDGPGYPGDPGENDGNGGDGSSSSAPSAADNRPATGGAGRKNEQETPAARTGTTKKYLDLSTGTSCSISAHTGSPADTSSPASSCSCAGANAGGQFQKLNKITPISDQNKELSRNTLHQHGGKLCEPVGESGRKRSEKPHSGQQAPINRNHAVSGGSRGAAEPPREVQAREYKLLDTPEHATTCWKCGRRTVSYIEKLTKSRLSRPKGRQDVRKICRKCFDAAVRREQAATPPLPGVVDLSSLVRVTSQVGKCSVCHMGNTAWRDPGADLGLCEACYSRECRGRAKGGS